MDEPNLVKKPSKEEKDWISSIFYGKIQHVISYQNEKNEVDSKVVSDNFSDILLNVASQKDIYATWENEYTN